MAKTSFLLAAVLIFGVSLGGQEATVELWLVRPCVIVRSTGSDYTYVEGSVPGDVRQKQRFDNKDIHNIIKRGGVVEILPVPSNDKDLWMERHSCNYWNKNVPTHRQKREP